MNTPDTTPPLVRPVFDPMDARLSDELRLVRRAELAWIKEDMNRDPEVFWPSVYAEHEKDGTRGVIGR